MNNRTTGIGSLVKLTLAFFLLFGLICKASAQVKIGDNPTSINPNSALEVESSNKGFLYPRVALSATDDFSPLTAFVVGMTVYNTATAGTGGTAVTPGLYYSDGTQWIALGTGANEPWNKVGTATGATSNTDDIYINGQVGMGTSTPETSAALDVSSLNKGVLVPRLTATQRNNISNPSNGLIIYNTTEDCINIYNQSQTRWKSLCGDEDSKHAVFSPVCGSLSASGNYTTGQALNPVNNQLTLDVLVSDTGSYLIYTSGGGMYFSDAGSFSTTGTHTITLQGQGYPLVAGLNFLALNINGSICSTVLTVGNGLANISDCGTLGALTGNVYANEPIIPLDVYQSYTVGPSYTGGSAYGVSSPTVNGIRISLPLNGNLNGSGAPIDWIISGTGLVPGNTTLTYTINGYTCSFTVPVQSGTGNASAVNCSGALNGTYLVGTPMNGSNTKEITLTVNTPGFFYLRTNTANGVYFEGSATASASGSLNVSLSAVGTPISNTTDIYTITVSSSATTFVACTFNVSSTLPSSIPEFDSLNCASLSAEVSYIKSSNTDAQDSFGGYIDYNSIAYGKGTKISSDGLTLAVGAVGEDGNITGGNINSTNNNNWTDAGAVYIYTRTTAGTNWTFQAKVKPTQLNAGDSFGNSLDLSTDGNTLVVGSVREDGSGTGVNATHNNTATYAGAAYVFVRSGNTWSQQAYLKANNTEAYDYFGASVSISGDGNTVAVGAVAEQTDAEGINPTPNNALSAAGAVYTFTRAGSSWSFDAFIKGTNPSSGDFFGLDVALNEDGSTLAVGAAFEDGSNMGINPIANNSATNAGAVYVFKKTAGTWAQEAYIKAGQVNADDWFGISVDLDGSGNRLVVGTLYEDGNGSGVNPPVNESATNSGAAYVYKRTGSTWAQEAYLKATNNVANIDFGNSVNISNNGEHIIVGAWGEDQNNTCIETNYTGNMNSSGAAYSYSLLSGSWTTGFQFKIPTAVGINTDDRFGGCVSINSDGTSIAISSFDEDGSGSGINPTPDNSATRGGCVIVYTIP